MQDFRIEDHGSIVLLYPLTLDASVWVEDHLPEDRQEWAGGAVVVEPRYVGAIVEGLSDDGLTVGV